MWQAFNDRIRDDSNKSLFRDEEDKELYESNCIKLIELLDRENIEDRIMIAELYRNLGNFDECKKMLETVNDDKYNDVKETMSKECEKNNQMVVKFFGDDNEY